MVDGNKIKVPSARIVAINNDIPVEAIEACGLRMATAGQVITEGKWLVLGVAVTQNGGECYAHNGAVVIDKREEE